MWFLVATEEGVAAVEIRRGIITDASDLLDWAIGLTRLAMRAECARRGWETEQLD